MNLGIITYVAGDKSHGYLLTLDDLNEKYVFEVIKKNDRSQSCYIRLRGEDFDLKKFQIVSYLEKSDWQGRKYAKISSTHLKAIVKPSEKSSQIIVTEFDNSIYIIEAKNKNFSDSNSGVVKVKIMAKIGRYSADFKYDEIITSFGEKVNTGFWLDKLVKLSSIYSKKYAPIFDTVFEAIVKFLQKQLQEKFDLHKLLTKVILKIEENCKITDYNSLIYTDYNPLIYFISCWQDKYVDFFCYANMSKIININIQLKLELWLLDIYPYEELFPGKQPIPIEAFDYVTQQNKDWQKDFLLKCKSVGNNSKIIKQVLWSFITIKLPTNLDDLNSNLKFVGKHFPELKSSYIEELKRCQNPKEQILLWENKLIEQPSLQILKNAFNDVSDETKAKIINTVPTVDKILFTNLSLKSDIKLKSYYKNLFAIIHSLISATDFCVFDIEYDGHEIIEIAFTDSNQIVSATSKIEIERLYPHLQEIFCKPNVFLTGHNIEEFDIPLLKEKIELPQNINVVDTLHIETILSPTLKSYALDTKHKAKEDVAQTLKLLTNQIIRLIHIPKIQFSKIEKFANSNFINFIHDLRKNISENPPEVFQLLENEKTKFFINKETGKQRIEELAKSISEKINKPAIIISPKELYPLLAELPNIQFISEQHEYSRIISKKKVNNLPDGTLEKFLLQSFIEKCKVDNKTSIFANLPSRIKILISKNATLDFITEQTVFEKKSPNHFCFSLDEFIKAIAKVQESNRSIFLLESDLISVSHKTLLKTFDYAIFQQRLNRDSFWVYFTGGQSRVEINRDELKKLNIENVPDYFEFFWIEKTSFDKFLVWGNYDFKKLLRKELGKDKVIEQSFNRNELQKINCNYVIPKSKYAKLSITRHNPETRYRDRYWTFQTNLVKKIISKNINPTVLIINQEKEKQKLYDYFTSIGYYVPDFNASEIRQANLLASNPTKRKLLIVTKEQIPDLVLSEDLNGVNFIIDSFELEEKWFTAKGTGILAQIEKVKSGLKFKSDNLVHSKRQTEEDDEFENSNPVSSNQDVFVLLKIQKPIIDYYRWLFHSTVKNSVVWLTDSRLGDFSGLDEEWKATRKFIPIWSKIDKYEEKYKIIKEFFPSPKPKEEIKLDIDATKEALRDIFLKNEKISHEWYPYQHDFLNEILPADKDILVTLPTGGGKSILFQAPALYRGSISGRLTIVVTPLKALMEDHVNKLWNLNFWGSVEFINQDRKDIQYIYRRIAGGEILMLYITPERFRSKSFINTLKMRLESDGGLEYAVYDEAHCISQWGLDFRPDYLNSTNVNIALKETSQVKFPLLLFSATVSEQIYNDFQSRFKGSINRLENYLQAYNPLREHIAINFETSEDADEKLTQIAQALYNENFNPENSRCLIFVRRRRDAEENVQKLEKKLNKISGRDSFIGKVAYFHAGMNGEERQDVYNAYKSGEIYILLATKAFGMGMDIPNIHYIYHYGPSGTLEDYLQEVGRAGRNKEQLLEAGFNDNRKIETKCFLENDDFGKIKTLLQNSITWTNLVAVFKLIGGYYSKFRNFETPAEKKKPIVLPFNIINKPLVFDDINDKQQLLRLSLYWLEKLERIKLGFYAPGQLEFSKFNKPNENQIDSQEQRKLIEEVEKAWNEKYTGAESISIELNKLWVATKFSNLSDLFKLIFKCQKKEIFRYENKLVIYPTKKKMDELKHFYESKEKPHFPTMEAVYDLSINLMNLTSERQQKQFEGNVLEKQKKTIAGEFFNENTLPWFVERDKKRIQKEQKDFERNKVKFAFTLADFIPKVRHQTLITHKLGQKSKIVQVVYNGCKNKNDWKKFLKEFKKDLISLLKYVSQTYINKGTKRYNASDFALKLGLEEKDTEYIENLLAFANWLGYLHYKGTFLPMGVELYLQSKKKIRHKESNSLDKRIHDEFQTTQKLRELRLVALECLSSIESKQEKDKFITDYFACNDSHQIIALLIQHFGNGHKALKAFRDEALKIAYDELSEEQKKVYDEDISKNIQVIAGPGSGKTHTLILRVARLIHSESIKPENILVLAYNRAIVVELKERLTKLFASLGYSKIIQRLKVFTFHGFCKFCLKDAVSTLEFADWIPKFAQTAKSQPGIISNQLGVIKYVFVDEFQDITSERLELLKLIANPQDTFTTVIGDPNQSIYGYERVDEGGSRSPRENYDSFATIYNPIVLRIGDNFRSYPQILTAAEQLLSYNKDTFDFVPLKPKKNAKHTCREIISCEGINDSWLVKLGELIQEINPETKNKYRQIAIMFRRNVEIYRAFNLIEKKKQEQNLNIRIRIQGEGEEFTRTREIAWVIDNFYTKKLKQRLISDFIEQYKTYQFGLRTKFPNWDFYYFNFFECLLHEFSKVKEDGSTYEDLVEFIQELAQKDDGQLSKIYYNNLLKVIEEDPKIEIVLTTMHKVKGLEFDAVMIPASLTNLPMIESEIENFGTEEYRELVEEERRLMYVAYTRAKYRLIVYYGNREKAMMNGDTHIFPVDEINTLGISVPSGIDKYFIGWGATDNGNSVFNMIEQTLKFGSTISLRKATNNWFLNLNGSKIGCLSKEVSNNLSAQTNGHTVIEGFRVSNIYKWTLEDTRKFDIKNGTNYETTWTDTAKNRGYIYLIEFSGYGTAN